MMPWTNSTSLQILLKNDLKKSLNSEIRLYVLNSVLFVAMATSHLILQRFLFLNQVIQELHSYYDAMNQL